MISMSIEDPFAFHLRMLGPSKKAFKTRQFDVNQVLREFQTCEFNDCCRDENGQFCSCNGGTAGGSGAQPPSNP